MAAPRTRKPKVDALRRVAAALLLAAPLAGSAAAATPSPYAPGTLVPEVAIALASGDAGQQRLRIDGAWPTPCLPAQAQISRAGQDLRVETRSTRSLCTRYPMPFHFDIDLAAALGQPLEPGVYRVSFYAANAATGPLELRDFRLLNVGQATLAPESGFWWPERDGASPADSAQGSSLSLELQGDTLAASLLTYDSDGRADWLFGSGALLGRTARITLLGMRDGPSPFGGARRAPQLSQQVSLQLELLGAGRAIAWIGWYEEGSASQPVLRLQSIPFARQSLVGPTEAASWSGRWQLQRGEGQPLRSIDLQEPQRLDATHFVLTDPAGWTLSCRQAAGQPGAPPEACVLTQAGSEETIEFDAVGLQRLLGRDRAGAAASLQRPPP